MRFIHRRHRDGRLLGEAQESGGGIYGDLIRHTQADFASRGFSTMLVSTQVNNFAVQKVWAREGFHLFEAWDTYHVNALLSAAPELLRSGKTLRLTSGGHTLEMELSES